MIDYTKLVKFQFKALDPQFFEEQKFIARNKTHLYKQVKFRKQQLQEFLNSKIVVCIVK
jgi:hypothetical protein